jgi:hypothetical protein
MTQRGLLRNQLKAAWAETISRVYSHARINSERGLQVHFCIKLLEQWDAKWPDAPEEKNRRRIFVEPTVILPGCQKRCYPDLVICNSQRVIGVVEFKYTPRTLPDTMKDFDTLRFISEAVGQELTINNNRHRGPSEVRHYQVANDAVLCWAAIHTDQKTLKIEPDQTNPLSKRYLELRAVAGMDQVETVVNGKVVIASLGAPKG